MAIQERLCNRIRQQTENFLQGLHLFVPDSLLALFDESGMKLSMQFIVQYIARHSVHLGSHKPEHILKCHCFAGTELELLLCGVREYKLSELKKYHSVVSGDIFFGRTLKWFWAALEGFSSEQFAKLLQFTTGSSQLPPGGFAELSPMFQGCYYKCFY